MKLVHQCSISIPLTYQPANYKGIHAAVPIIAPSEGKRAWNDDRHSCSTSLNVDRR